MRIRAARILDVRICWIVLLAFGVLSLMPANSRASLVQSRLSSGEILSQRNIEMNKIRQALETEVVAQRLADFGLSQEEVAAKLPTLSDEQPRLGPVAVGRLGPGPSLGGKGGGRQSPQHSLY